jgi:hypothetical protein
MLRDVLQKDVAFAVRQIISAEQGFAKAVTSVDESVATER